MSKTIEVEFKNPDFDSELLDVGLSKTVVSKLRRKAQFGEYWTLCLEFNEDGTFTGKIV